MNKIYCDRAFWPWETKIEEVKVLAKSNVVNDNYRRTFLVQYSDGKIEEVDVIFEENKD
mgnify:CR=1 FL=1